MHETRAIKPYAKCKRAICPHRLKSTLTICGQDRRSTRERSVLARSIGQEAGAYRPAFARAAPAATPSFGARKKRWRDLELAIDLAEDFGSRRWWRGFATLTALTVATALMAPPFLPLPGGHPAPVNEAEEAQYAAAGIGALVEGIFDDCPGWLWFQPHC